MIKYTAVKHVVDGTCGVHNHKLGCAPLPADCSEDAERIAQELNQGAPNCWAWDRTCRDLLAATKALAR